MGAEVQMARDPAGRRSTLGFQKGGKLFSRLDESFKLPPLALAPAPDATTFSAHGVDGPG